VVLARLLLRFKERADIVGEVLRRIDAPREEVLQGGHPAVATLREKGFIAHWERECFSSAMASAARANSAPRLIAPKQRSSACCWFSAVTTPLMMGVRVSSDTR